MESKADEPTRQSANRPVQPPSAAGPGEQDTVAQGREAQEGEGPGREGQEFGGVGAPADCFSALPSLPTDGPSLPANGDSVALQTGRPQPDADLILPCNGGERGPLAHVVLFQPEIPQNTGNIGRTCVAVGAPLWIVRPAAFRLDDRKLRRAGLDYWQHLKLRDVENWGKLREELPETPTRRYWFLSRFAEQNFWEAPLGRGDVIVFGSETSGLPPSIHEEAGESLLRLPTTPWVRSLNLSNTAAVVLYDMVRRDQEGRLRGGDLEGLRR